MEIGASEGEGEGGGEGEVEVEVEVEKKHQCKWGVGVTTGRNNRKME